MQQLRGVGPIIATAIVANVGDAKQDAAYRLGDNEQGNGLPAWAGGSLSREQPARKMEYPTTIAKQAVDGQQVEPALAEPENVCGLRARNSDREPARE